MLFLPLLIKIDSIKSTHNDSLMAQLTTNNLPLINKQVGLKAIPSESGDQVKISVADGLSFPRFFPVEMALCTKTTSGDESKDELILSNSIIFYSEDSDVFTRKFGLDGGKQIHTEEYIRNANYLYDTWDLVFVAKNFALEQDKELLKTVISDDNAYSLDNRDEVLKRIYNSCKEKGLLSIICGANHDDRIILDKRGESTFKKRLFRYLLSYPSINIKIDELLSLFKFTDPLNCNLKPGSSFFITFHLQFFNPENLLGRLEGDDSGDDHGNGNFVFARTNWLQVSKDGKSIEGGNGMGIWVKGGIFVIISIIIVLLGLLIYSKMSGKRTQPCS